MCFTLIFFARIIIIFNSCIIIMIDQTESIDFRHKAKPGRIVRRNMSTTDEEVKQISLKTDCPKIQEILIINPQLSTIFITHQGILQISKIKWDSLTFLDLGFNSIGDKGCKYLTKTHMPDLEKVHLYGNNIGDTGILHLSKATWTKLQILSMSYRWAERGDWMRVGGYSYLIRGNWMSLQGLWIGNFGKSQTGKD